MIQIAPLEEKQARYRIIRLLMEGKSEEAEAQLAHYSSFEIIPKPYVDFYTLILEEIRSSHAKNANDISTQEKGTLDKPSDKSSIGAIQ